MKWIASLLPVMVLAQPGLASAQITDPAGDWWNNYGGKRSGDMDVISASGTYDTGTQSFTIIATMNGAIGTSANAHYIWGVNTGSGTASFASSGLTACCSTRPSTSRPAPTGRPRCWAPRSPWSCP